MLFEYAICSVGFNRVSDEISGYAVGSPGRLRGSLGVGSARANEQIKVPSWILLTGDGTYLCGAMYDRVAGFIFWNARYWWMPYWILKLFSIYGRNSSLYTTKTRCVQIHEHNLSRWQFTQLVWRIRVILEQRFPANQTQTKPHLPTNISTSKNPLDSFLNSLHILLVSVLHMVHEITHRTKRLALENRPISTLL